MSVQNSLRKVYKEKTIQNAWQFMVYLDDYTPAGSAPQELFIPLEPYAARAVTIPQYRFRKESMDFNTLGKQFPVFDTRQGLDLRIEFDEDFVGRTARMVRSLQRRIMNMDGTYNPPNTSKINKIRVDILSPSGIVTTRYWFNGCFFIEAEDFIFSYDSSENIKFVVTFSVDYVTIEPAPDFNG